MVVDKEFVDRLLLSLQNNDLPFGQYRLAVNKDGEPILLGKGSYSYVYRMINEKETTRSYALKVIGLNNKKIEPAKFRETVRLQKMLAAQCEYIADVIDSKEIAALLDEEGHFQNVVQNGDEAEGFLELQFVLEREYEPVIQRDMCMNVYLNRNDLEDEKEVIRFAIQIGQALFTAHNNCVLHRDIKLENVLWDSESGAYRLTDFGFAKNIQDGNADTVIYTDRKSAPVSSSAKHPPMPRIIIQSRFR